MTLQGAQGEAVYSQQYNTEIKNPKILSSEYSKMTQSINETPAGIHSCSVSDCSKTYKRNNGLTLHMANVHQLLLNNVLSPLATLARNMFGANNVSDDISIQGNSVGKINSPKVLTSASFLCGVCNEPLSNKEEVTNHMKNDHKDEDEAQIGQTTDDAPNEQNDNAHNELNDEDEEGLEEIMEEHELYEALNTLTKSVDDPQKVQQLQDKLGR